ncbi:beta-ketoacyl synthase N-terminal-like domain-containing protein [Luteolibacter soli]|uniref:Beta-ketoacyl synthase N-terminal-like domain-containing protein n=1 Tax=Luteolibacter soli TaxID=3135280 RepID=A0ABU9AQL7_9BACT
MTFRSSSHQFRQRPTVQASSPRRFYFLGSGDPTALVPRIDTPLAITGLGALSGLGVDIAGHVSAVNEGRTCFRPLADLLGNDSPHRDLPASWIEPRKLLLNRKWAPASMAALHVARQAIADAGWTASELECTALFLGTSRGTAAGWIDPWPERRAFPLMAASNSLHSEPAAAVSIELGIRGPWQVQASGCAAGLDALGMAALWLSAGLAERALVVAVDLPLSPCLLDSYAATGILSKNGINDPYSPETTGILPAEAAAAIALERRSHSGSPLLSGYLANADAADAIGMPAGAPGVARLLEQALRKFGPPVALCPHASGTASHATLEPAAILASLKNSITLCPLKPYTGHGIGGGGLLETAILAAFLRENRLPPPLPHLTCPAGLTMTPPALPPGATVFKLASALGGKNSLVALQASP